MCIYLSFHSQWQCQWSLVQSAVTCLSAGTVALVLLVEKFATHIGPSFSCAYLVPLEIKWAWTCAGDGEVLSWVNNVSLVEWVVVVEVVWCRCCGGWRLFAERQSAIYHEPSRTQPKLESKRDVFVGMSWCVLGCGLVWCACLLCCGLSSLGRFL